MIRPLLLCCIGVMLSAADHRFLVLDNGANRLVLVDQAAPAKGWSISIPAGGRDLQRIGDRILVSHGQGATEYALANGAAGWSWTKGKEITSARRMPDGSTWFVCPEHLLHLPADGTAPVEIPLPEPRQRTRLLREDPAGGFLLGLAEAHQVLGLNAEGKPVRQWSLPGKGYVAQRLPDGHILASTGAACSVVELDDAGTVVRTYGGTAAHPQARLLWFSGFQLLGNGLVAVANWCGHGKAGKGPHIVAFDRDNHLAWSWEDHAAATTVTNLLILDE